MYLHIDRLIVEVTRKCNITCDHCLRGDAEKINMKVKYVDALFSQINSIDNITFTGGEPQLVPGIIEKIRYSAMIHDIEINNFYCVTNGLVNSKKFVEVMQSWWNFCTDNDISMVEISTDTFHQHQGYLDDDLRLFNLDFVNKKSKMDRSNKWIINEGRAAEYGIGFRANTADSFYKEEYKDTLQIMDGTLYLNCYGQLINGCDWSYESQRNRKDIQIGNILDPNFSLRDWGNNLKRQDDYLTNLKEK